MKILGQYDYHKFLKIKRKYYKRHCVKRIDYFNGKRFVSYWEKDNWVGYVIPSFLTYSTDKSISREVKSVIGSTLYYDTLDIVKNIYDNIWEEYKFSLDNEHLYQGFVIGVILTNRDTYYLVSNKKYSKDKKDWVLIPMFWKIEKEN